MAVTTLLQYRDAEGRCDIAVVPVSVADSLDILFLRDDGELDGAWVFFVVEDAFGGFTKILWFGEEDIWHEGLGVAVVEGEPA